MRNVVRLLVGAALVAALAPPSSPAEAVAALAPPMEDGVGEGTAAPSTNESWACGQPYTDGSYASRIGSLPDSEVIGGPRADLLGRTIGEVRDSLVLWTVPMSGGHEIYVHERMLPALDLVTANLAAEEANGNYYAAKSSQTFGFSPRTIGGRYQISLHAHGVALDINSATNPYSSVLITDMPDWYVKAWTEAGFCWGGDWASVKDPMHFSWMGPVATPGYGDLPAAYPVHTSAADFSDEALETTTEFGAADPDYTYLLGDGDSDGVADVFQLVPRDNGTRLEYSQTDRNHDWCSVGRDHALDIDVGDRVALLGDYSRVGRNDLLLLDTSGSELSIEVSLKPTGFAESVIIDTSIQVAGSDAYLFGDHNRDSYLDLFVIRRDTGTSVEVYSGVDDFATQLLTVDTGLGDTSSSLFTLGDTDLDELPDLFVVTPGASASSVDVLGNGYDGVDSSFSVEVTGDIIDVLVNDYDGDGRGDLWFWDATGTLTVRLGNSRLSGVPVNFWHNDPNWECDADAQPYAHDGLFRDDDGNLHEGNIEAIALAGVSKGCNPPFNDDYCPDTDVTRGEMAAFLVRALGLTDEGAQDWFSDDDESVFEADINKLATAGVTLGCNPPDNTEFCPNDRVTRGQMAAFLVRALDLTDGSGADVFDDDDASIFEDHIDLLATAGITQGCNPPANTHFCPARNVGRDEMASFFARALPLIEN